MERICTRVNAMPDLPGITSLIVLVLSIAFLGIILDRIILSQGLDAWRKKVFELWDSLNKSDVTSLTQDVNHLYRDLFDYIYGSRFFSWRRLWTSALTSMAGMLIITLIVGIEGSFWTETLEGAPENISFWGQFYFVISLPIITNLPADFLSLAETRLVLRWSLNRGTLAVIGLIIFDLVLTATLFSLATGLLSISDVVFFFDDQEIDVISNLFFNVELMFTDPREFYSTVITKEGFLIPFLTTFFSSVIWMFFVTTYFLVRLAHNITPVTNYVLYEASRSRNPILILTSLVNITLVAGYTAYVLLA